MFSRRWGEPMRWRRWGWGAKFVVDERRVGLVHHRYVFCARKRCRLSSIPSIRTSSHRKWRTKKVWINSPTGCMRLRSYLNHSKNVEWHALLSHSLKFFIWNPQTMLRNIGSLFHSLHSCFACQSSIRRVIRVRIHVSESLKSMGSSNLWLGLGAKVFRVAFLPKENLKIGKLEWKFMECIWWERRLNHASWSIASTVVAGRQRDHLEGNASAPQPLDIRQNRSSLITLVKSNTVLAVVVEPSLPFSDISFYFVKESINKYLPIWVI